MDPDIEIYFDCMPFFRLYESGRVERFCAVLNPCSPSIDTVTGISSKDVHITPSISARIYIPTIAISQNSSSHRLPLLLYFHGGAFIFGSAFGEDHHNYTNSLAAQNHLIIVSVNYRLAPEHRVPAAYDDACLTLQWAASGITDAWLANHADVSRVFLCGDSAGANIAHNVAMRDTGVRIEGVVLACPYFLQEETTESDALNPGFVSGLKESWLKAVSPEPSLGFDDYRINPVNAEGAPSLSGLGCRRLLVCVAGVDPLRDRGRDYYEKVRESGWKGKVEIYESEGEGHVFHIDKPDCEEAKALSRKIFSFLKSDDAGNMHKHPLMIPNQICTDLQIIHEDDNANRQCYFGIWECSKGGTLDGYLENIHDATLGMIGFKKMIQAPNKKFDMINLSIKVLLVLLFIVILLANLSSFS